jgi:hypothetical protein
MSVQGTFGVGFPHQGKSASDAAGTSTLGQVGITNVTAHGPGGSDTLPLLTTDDTIIGCLFVDTIAAEAFWMGGRVALTGGADNPQGGYTSVTVTSNATV